MAATGQIWPFHRHQEVDGPLWRKQGKIKVISTKTIQTFVTISSEFVLKQPIFIRNFSKQFMETKTTSTIWTTAADLYIGLQFCPFRVWCMPHWNWCLVYYLVETRVQLLLLLQCTQTCNTFYSQCRAKKATTTKKIIVL